MRPFVIQSLLTPRKADRLDRYLLEISRLPMITMEDEARLARLIREGDPDALEQLVHANLRFVVSVAKQYQFRGLSLSDLINEGNVGLIRAAGRFDETKGFKFISYAVWWIRQSMTQALSDGARLVRLPANRIGLGLRVHQAACALEQVHERTPTLEEVAESLQLKVSDVRLANSIADRHESLDAPLPGREDSSLYDELAIDDSGASDRAVAHTQSLQTELGRSLSGLSERDRTVVIAFFGIGQTAPSSLQEIANSLGMTAERVRQIKDKALRSLRGRSNAGLLRSYL
ncbi:RNA polymerase sigma factor RpoD/SigA [Flaviaesturariibacter amylovorans]|uniref:RNA polymerase sigma factor RpoD/SigA n=1 Tax=Flaviaesturariibacter amylovorans TaxID=1084520 RepID=A0ABP8H7L9_9BACT